MRRTQLQTLTIVIPAHRTLLPPYADHEPSSPHTVDLITGNDSPTWFPSRSRTSCQDPLGAVPPPSYTPLPSLTYFGPSLFSPLHAPSPPPLVSTQSIPSTPLPTSPMTSSSTLHPLLSTTPLPPAPNLTLPPALARQHDRNFRAALEEYQATQDPSNWGKRPTHPRFLVHLAAHRGWQADAGPGWVARWVRWVGEALAPPEGYVVSPGGMGAAGRVLYSTPSGW